MATRIKLTQGRVDGFSCPPGKDQDFLRDSEMPGLALRTTAAGNKGYVYEGKLDGKTIRVTIGDPEALNLAEARDKAAEIRVMIRAGRDPRVVKAEAIAADAAKRQKAKAETTPALEAWQAYITARTPKWSARHCADHEYMAREGGQAITRGRRAGMAEAKEPGILRPLLEKPLRAIDRDAVAVWLAVEVERRPTRTRLAVALLGAFLRWCADNPAYRDQANPDAVARMKKDMPRPGARDDCLQREQLRPWFDAVGKIPNRTQSAYLQTLLLTGARRNELAPLQWADVDLQWNSLTIRDKVEGERTIPLTPYVKALLLSIKPASVSSLRGGAAAAASPFVFASNSSSGHITEPRIAHNRALAAAGLPPLTLHGLRRSFGTLAEWVEAPAGVVAQVMGHAPSAIAEKHYRRRPLDLLRMWHTKIEGWVLEQAGIEQPASKAAEPKAVIAA